jgi:hypothetical protein
MRNQHGEIREPFAPRLPDRHRIGRRGGLKADAEEHDLLRRILARDLQRVHGRINHAHIGAVGARFEKIAMRAGHAQHIAVGRERHAQGNPAMRWPGRSVRGA